MAKSLPYDAEIEYLQSSGTQWIDTGVYGAMSHTYDLTFMQMDNNEYRLWGVFGQSSFIGYNMSLTYGDSTWFVRWESKNGSQRFLNIGRRNTLKHNLEISGGHVYLDGLSKGISAGNDSDLIIGYNIFLFTINPANTTPSNNAKMRLYSYKDTDADGTIVRDFIPVRVGLVGYMYDTVSGELFGNAGTGDFVLGPDL